MPLELSLMNRECVWSVVWYTETDWAPFVSRGLRFSDGHFRHNAEILADYYRSGPDIEFVAIVKTERRRELFASFLDQLRQESNA
jgi:hypothetical protein